MQKDLKDNSIFQLIKIVAVNDCYHEIGFH